MTRHNEMQEQKMKLVTQLNAILPPDILNSEKISSFIGGLIYHYNQGQSVTEFTQQYIQQNSIKEESSISALKLIENLVTRPESITRVEYNHKFLKNLRHDLGISLHDDKNPTARATVIFGDNPDYTRNLRHFSDFVQEYCAYPEMVHHLIIDKKALEAFKRDPQLLRILSDLQSRDNVKILDYQDIFSEISTHNNEYGTSSKRIFDLLYEQGHLANANDWVRAEFCIIKY